MSQVLFKGTVNEFGEENWKDISFPLFLNGDITSFPSCFIKGKEKNVISPQKFKSFPYWEEKSDILDSFIYFLSTKSQFSIVF